MNPRRDTILSSCKDRVHDALVVGGGITGAGVARDLAMRGLKAILVEKGDFASGTSSKSGKLVHGGARYLKNFHFGLVFEACRERWLLARRVAPHLVHPVQFVYPFFRGSRTPRWLAAIGLALYDMVSLYRNEGRLKFLSQKELDARFPNLRSEGCVGGLAYWDCACLDFRLVIDTLKSAHRAGADLLNYAELVSSRKTSGGFESTIRDVLSEREYVVHSRTIVNTAGAWADDVQVRLDSSPRFGLALSAGIHLVIPRRRLPITSTFALEVPADGRMIYSVPWDDVVLVGTTDDFYTGDKDHVPVGEEMAAYLLDAVNFYFPGAKLAGDDVASAFAGIRPLLAGKSSQSEDKLPRDDKILVHPSGVVSVTGGKLTTYRAMAERVVDALVAHFFRDRPVGPCRTGEPIVGGESPCPVGASPRVQSLWKRYGSAAPAVEKFIERGGMAAEPITENIPYLWGEVDYAVQEEFVERLDDLLDRRWGRYLLMPDASFSQSVLTRIEERIHEARSAVNEARTFA